MGLAEENSFEPGTTLDSNILNFQGKVIFGKGTVLTPDNIKTLKAWGAFGSEAEESPSDWNSWLRKFKGQDQFKRAKKEVIQIFKHTSPDHPVIVELMRLCIQRKLELSKKE